MTVAPLSSALPRSAAPSPSASHSPSFVGLMMLSGLLLPFYMAIYVGGAKFPPGRLIVLLLLVPALIKFCRRGGRLIAADLFVTVTMAWTVIAVMQQNGDNALTSTIAEALEFAGGYTVARAFFFGRPALESFIASLRIVTIALVVLALADLATNSFLTHDIVARIMGVAPPLPQYRTGGLIRATATLDHPILLGSYFVFAAAIFIYAEQTVVRRLFYVGLCLFGCILCQSSAPLQSFVIMLGVYAFDRTLTNYPWRWHLLAAAIAAFVLTAYIISNNPIGWIVSNLTFDPQTGYYRIMVWDVAMSFIGLSPIWGAFEPFHNDILDNTVDCVWLVLMLRFGFPIVALMILTNAATFWPRSTSRDPYLNRMQTAFTLVLMTYMTSLGLTVHFWNYMWIFWGLCLGIRASLREESFAPAKPRSFEPPMARYQHPLARLNSR